MTVVSEGILVHQLKRVSNTLPVADQCGGIKDRSLHLTLDHSSLIAACEVG